jgi:hypothetical protein
MLKDRKKCRPLSKIIEEGGGDVRYWTGVGYTDIGSLSDSIAHI